MLHVISLLIPFYIFEIKAWKSLEIALKKRTQNVYHPIVLDKKTNFFVQKTDNRSAWEGSSLTF